MSKVSVSTGGSTVAISTSGTVFDPALPVEFSSRVVVGGHYLSTGTTPSVGSGIGDCGSGPTITVTDSTGTVVVGSGVNGGECTVTFAYRYAVTPRCFTNSSGVNLVMVGNVTTAAMKIKGTIIAGDTLTYWCVSTR